MLASFLLGGTGVSRPNLTEFRESVRKRVETIPYGKVVTYADIGGAACANVGAAMEYLVSHFDPELAWHRVVNTDGSLSNKAMYGQRDRLQAEGVSLLSKGRVELDRFRWTALPFKPIK